MTTFKQMVDETMLNLAGFGMRHDPVTYITGSLSSSATSTTIADTESIGKGVIEIDDELIYVSSFDRATGVVNIPPFGRGFAGTTAATHAANAMVTINPTYTRQAVKKALNDTVLAVFPDLFGVASHTFTYSPAVTTYSLPAAVQSVLAVSYQAIGSSQEWRPVRGWRVDPMADTTAFPTGNTITLTSVVEPGRTVRVTYTTEPAVMAVDADVFTTVTGLPESCRDVITFGAAYRLLSFVDSGRTQFMAPEALAQSAGIQSGSATNSAKYVYALFQQRLQEEKRKLQEKFPVRIHFTN